jgi:hypothetical protein
MARKKNPYVGKWRILEMELWDQDYIDEITEGHFTFEKDGLGYFRFGLVEGQMDYQIEKYGELERIEFSWLGQDENDLAMGRGHATLKENILEGRFYFHLGDDSWFKAERKVKVDHISKVL